MKITSLYLLENLLSDDVVAYFVNILCVA